jgi:hypothetical protein
MFYMLEYPLFCLDEIMVYYLLVLEKYLVRLGVLGAVTIEENHQVDERRGWGQQEREGTLKISGEG